MKMKRALTISAVALVGWLAPSAGSAQPFPPLSALNQHYLCYKPKVLAGPTSQGVHIVEDQFGPTQGEAKKAGLFCNPAAKDGPFLPGFDPIRPDDHLKCYKYKWKWPVPFVRNASNQFGLEQLSLQKAKFLCVPTQKIPPGGPVSPNEQHYLCYKPKVLQGNSSQGTHVVEDQFGSSNGQVKKAKLFCNPAAKDQPYIPFPVPGYTVPRPNDHLKCYLYKVKLPAPIVVTTVNQFGTEQLSLQKSKFLCVPTEKD